MNIPAPIAETLGMIAEVASVATDQWWVIGSTAVVLHGRRVPHVGDVDVLMSARDADALLTHVGEFPLVGHSNERFLSQIFGTWTRPPLPVEVMGGLGIATPSGWRDVSLSTHQPITLDGGTIYVPSADELVRLLHSFGRAKDLERADLLQS